MLHTLTCVIFHHVVVVAVGGGVGQIHGGSPRKKMTKLSRCWLHCIGSTNETKIDSRNMLFSQFQTWGEGRKGFIFPPINKKQNFFVDVDEDDTWKMKKKNFAVKKHRQMNKKLYQSSTTRRPFLWPTKGNKSGQLGKKEKFSVPVCSRRMLPTDEKISRRLVVISEQATTFLRLSLCSNALYVCHSSPSLSFTLFCDAYVSTKLKKVKKAKTRKRERENFQPKD